MTTIIEGSAASYDERSFGRFVRARREQMNMSVRELAAAIGITPAYESDVEKGNRSAPLKFLDNYRKILNVTEADEEAFSDMVSASRGHRYEDINPYLSQTRLARVALRKARDYEVPDEAWMAFIKEMDEQFSKGSE